MMQNLLLVPPIAFLILLVFNVVQLRSLRIFSADVRNLPEDKGRNESYACGEDVPDHRVQPDYSQFFPFAFFFTIMHVAGLIVATVPSHSPHAITIAVIYLIAAAIGLLILFRR